MKLATMLLVPALFLASGPAFAACGPNETEVVDNPGMAAMGGMAAVPRQTHCEAAPAPKKAVQTESFTGSPTPTTPPSNQPPTAETPPAAEIPPQTGGTNENLTPDQLQPIEDQWSQKYDDNKVTIRRMMEDFKKNDPAVTRGDIDRLVPYLDAEEPVKEMLKDRFGFSEREAGQAMEALGGEGVGRWGQGGAGARKSFEDIVASHGVDTARVEGSPEFQKLRHEMTRLMSDPKLSGVVMRDDGFATTVMNEKDTGEHNQNWKNNQPDNPFAFKYSAANEMQNGDLSSAVKDLSHAIDLNPQDGEALTMRGEAEFMQHDMAAAARDAQAALRVDPNNAKAQQLLGLSHEINLGGAPTLGGLGSSGSGATVGNVGMDSGGGAALGGNAAAARSASAVSDAQSAMRLKDYDLAVARLDQAIALNGGNAAAYNLRAIAYERLGRPEFALKDALEGLKRAPKNALLLITKAAALNKLRRYKEAEQAARDALAIDPNNALAYNALAEALAGQRRNPEAIAALKSAAALDPRFNDKLQQALQLPSETDLTFLFPDDGPAAEKKTSAAAPRSQRFSSVVAGSLAGGLLLGLILLKLVSKPRRSVVDDVPVSPALTRRQEAAGLLRGRYQVGAQIGVGGMGIVYDGMDLNLKRRVAIKKMRDEIRLDRRERERFVGEAKVVAGLHHPGIVDVFAVLEEHDDVYLVFEFVTGKTLHDRVQTDGPMSVERATAILRAAGSALDYAHSRNVIHRDLKPSNIMLTDEGKVKVMDFGIARVAKDAMSHYSMTNTVVGTPPYMAPEQEQGVVRRESDVYALGVCLYEMLTGRMPFNGSGAGMLLNKINRTYVPATQARPGLPPALDEIFSRAFHPDPEQRYHSSHELVSAVEALAVPQKG